MGVLLYVLALLAALYAGAVLLVAKSSIHEIQAGVGLVVAAILLGAGAVHSAIERLRRAVTERPSSGA